MLRSWQIGVRRCPASLKIVGASGQGINSIGAIIAKGLKRSGYCVFGYREYPSLIQGRHASYQLDISNQRIRSTETKVNRQRVPYRRHAVRMRACQRDARRRSITPARTRCKSVLNEQQVAAQRRHEAGDREFKDCGESLLIGKGMRSAKRHGDTR